MMNPDDFLELEFQINGTPISQVAPNGLPYLTINGVGITDKTFIVWNGGLVDMMYNLPTNSTIRIRAMLQPNTESMYVILAWQLVS